MKGSRCRQSLALLLLAAPTLGLILSVSASAETIPDFGSAPVDELSSRPSGGIIVDAEVGTHDGYDRFVLNFDSRGIGGYSVSYVEALYLESGETVTVEGDAVIQVKVLANGPYDAPPPRDTIDAGYTSLLQVVGGRWWEEGYVEYALGTAQQREFRAFTLDGPPRLVVDIAHRELASEPTTETPGPPNTDSFLSSSFTWIILGGGVLFGMGFFVGFKQGRTFYVRS